MPTPNHCEKCGSQLSDHGRCAQSVAGEEKQNDSSTDATAPTFMMSSELTEQTAAGIPQPEGDIQEFGDCLDSATS